MSIIMISKQRNLISALMHLFDSTSLTDERSFMKHTQASFYKMQKVL